MIIFNEYIAWSANLTACAEAINNRSLFSWVGTPAQVTRYKELLAKYTYVDWQKLERA